MTFEPENSGSFGRRADGPLPAAQKPVAEALRPRPAAPPPQRRSRGSRSQFVVFLNFIVSAIFLMVLAAVAGAYFVKSAYEAPGPSTQASAVLIEPGSGVQEIAQQLQRAGLIDNAQLFWIGSRIFGGEGHMKAGEYEIKAAASMRDIVDVLKSGKSILHSLTIPEGLTVVQALQRIREHEALAGEMPDQVPQEGSLAADTQRFTRGTKRTDIVDKLLKDQRALVESLWDKRAPDLPLAGIDEFVTLASIVEKETGIAEERPRVAAVFVNRLNKGMRLQSDPTIIYGLYGGKGKPADKPIMQSDLKKQTPYNTYLIDGLPPTPIANPGRAALEAVANPPKTDEFYFVADGTGGHVFAKTLEEHNKNVANWRQVEKKKAEEAAKAASGGEPAAE